MRKITRREFTEVAAKTGAVSLLMLPAAPLTLSAGKKNGTMEPVTLDLTDKTCAALNTVGGAVKIDNPLDRHRPLIIIKKDRSEYGRGNLRRLQQLFESPFTFEMGNPRRAVRAAHAGVNKMDNPGSPGFFRKELSQLHLFLHTVLP